MEIQRALIERDRQAAEFAHPELRELHLRQDQTHVPARPDERSAQARERDAALLTMPPQADEKPRQNERPLPLPGGPRHNVDPIPVQGIGG